MTEPNYNKDQVDAINLGYIALAGNAAKRGPDKLVSDWVKAFRKESRYGRHAARAVVIKWFLTGWNDPRASVISSVRSDLWPVIMLGATARETERRRANWRKKYPCEANHPTKGEYPLADRQLMLAAVRAHHTAETETRAAQIKGWTEVEA